MRLNLAADKQKCSSKKKIPALSLLDTAMGTAISGNERVRADMGPISNNGGFSREEESSRKAFSPLTREAKLSVPTPIRIILPLIRGGIHSAVRCAYTYLILTNQLNAYTSNKN